MVFVGMFGRGRIKRQTVVVRIVCHAHLQFAGDVVAGVKNQPTALYCGRSRLSVIPRPRARGQAGFVDSHGQLVILIMALRRSRGD